MNSRQRRTNRRKGGSETLGERKPEKKDGRYEATPIPDPSALFIDKPMTYRGFGWKEDFWGGFCMGGLATIVMIVAWWMLVMGPLVRDLEQKQAFNELALVEAADAVRDALLMCP